MREIGGGSEIASARRPSKAAVAPCLQATSLPALVKPRHRLRPVRHEYVASTWVVGTPGREIRDALRLDTECENWTTTISARVEPID